MADTAMDPVPEDPREAPLMRAMAGFFDVDWYQTRYPDIVGVDLHPLQHFIRHGIAERRDPNRFFDSLWYAAHYPDVSASGVNPLLHYLQTGAAALRNPHPHFDAAWYAEQHPEATGNPLLYHIRTGQTFGYSTERPIDIRDYLPSRHQALAMPPKVVVDVVIPVYRGLEETRRCITSVLLNTGRPLGRIIVIDDRSPEPELSTWLQELSDKRKIHLVRNPRNVGFVTSVNRGMEAAGSHDVVLLNSDTEVPQGWLGRLTAQAYADRRTATVSPFSNNATICGYPANLSSPLPFGLPVSEVDDICRTANAGRAVDVPTTVGFCMYIRRKALKEVGHFDASRFTVGYGEENDFCLRASALGWKHRLACDTFVYHNGSVSFGSRANKLSARAMDLLLERYPDYQRDIARHVALDAVAPFRFAVTVSLFKQSNLPVILMVAHELGGGVRRHVDTLVERLRHQARFLLLQATDRGTALSVLSLPNHPTLTLPTERQDDLILVLRSMGVSRVHIHHLLGMNIDVRALILRLGVPFDVTVHDYYGICPQINLLPWRHSLYCGEPDVAGCNACIALRSSHGASDIVTWRAEQAWQFKDAAAVFCPSQDVLSRLQRHGLAANAVLAPHEAVKGGTWPLHVAPLNGPMRIAVLGTLVDHKGGRTVASVAGLVNPKEFEIYLIGHTDGEFSPAALRKMRVTGHYDEADLTKLIETVAPHLIWFPAVWPETFSYTLSAAIDAGIPILATRIGAHTERLAGRDFTWLADIATSPSGWIGLFAEIRDTLQNTTAMGRACAGAKRRGVSSKTANSGTRARAIASMTGSNDQPARPALPDFYVTNYLQRVARPDHGRRSNPRIVVLPERFDSGLITPCGYIRLLQPLYHPAIADGFDVRLTTAETIFDSDAEIIIVQRFAMPDTTAADRLAAHARAVGATLVFDLDDDLLGIPRGHPDAQLLRPRAKVVRRMLDLADVVWLSTPALAERLASMRPDAMVMVNGLDERIWTAPVTQQDQPVRILCMGTTTHDDDFAMIAPALVRLKAEYGDRAVIDVIGMTSHNNLPPGLNRISPPPNARRSYPGFVNWLTSVAPLWHIGLAPLLDTPFNRCKSPIKAMDYAALGLAVLASETPVYRNSIGDGPAGQLVANSSAAWYAALTWLLRNHDLRSAIAGRARNEFLAHASLASQAQARQGALQRLLGSRKTDAAA